MNTTARFLQEAVGESVSKDAAAIRGFVRMNHGDMDRSATKEPSQFATGCSKATVAPNLYQKRRKALVESTRA